VVTVVVLLRGLARGIEATNANTGDARNISRRAQKVPRPNPASLVSREQFRTLRYFEEIARNERANR